MARIKEVLGESADVVTSTTSYVFCKALKYAPNALLFTNPFMCMFLVYEEYACDKDAFNIWYLLIPAGIFLLAQLFHLVCRIAFKEVNGCPVARKRFTRRGANGELIFDKQDVYEMVEYLAEVEDYCEKYGKYRRKS